MKARIHEIMEESATFSIALATVEREQLLSDRFILGEMWNTIKEPKFECPHCGTVNQFTAYFKDKTRKKLILLHCSECQIQLTDDPEVLKSCDTVAPLMSRDIELLTYMPFTEIAADRAVSEQAYEFLSRAYTDRLELIGDDPSIAEDEGSSIKDEINDLIKLGAELKISFWNYIKENCTELQYKRLKELYNEQEE